jgi:hypothetical protein
MKSVRSQQVYDYQLSGPNAWYQDRNAEYYNVLHDFCVTVGTVSLRLDREDAWFRNVFKQSIGTPGECGDNSSSQAMASLLEQCDSLMDGNDTSGGTTLRSLAAMLLGWTTLLLVGFNV